MSDYAITVVVGRVGRASELKTTTNGQSMFSFSVAVNRQFSTDAGLQKETTWYKVTTFGKQAENHVKYVAMGKQVLVEGRLTPDKQTGGPRVYQRSDGTFGASFEMVAREVRYLSGPTDGQQSAPATESDYSEDEESPL